MRLNRALLLLGISLISMTLGAQGQTNIFPATGNVGIGTSTPSYPLHVWSAGAGVRFDGWGNHTLTVSNTSSGSSAGFIADNSASATLRLWNSVYWTLSNDATDSNKLKFANGGSALLSINTNGDIGVRTTSPEGILHLYHSGGANLQDLIIQTTVAGNEGISIRNSSQNWALGVRNDLSQAFNIRNVTSGSDAMVITPSGSVGLGTSAPGARLEVNGNLKLSGGSGASITFADGTTQSTAWTGAVCGGDYAESVDVSGDRRTFEPGDVLGIDDQHPSRFLKVAEPYSTAVAGVFSTKPGVLGRRQITPKSGDEVPLAMIGIVPMKVTAENGAIRVHDLLVSSGTPGFAMKGTDRSRMLGAVIGKAMGSLESGTGIIEVLVTLQ